MGEQQNQLVRAGYVDYERQAHIKTRQAQRRERGMGEEDGSVFYRPPLAERERDPFPINPNAYIGRPRGTEDADD
jgi:hypothetical protein